MSARDLVERQIELLDSGDVDGALVVAYQLRAALEDAAPRAASFAVELEPYVAWEPRPVPDPRSAGRDALMPAVAEIVETEGPVCAGRAFGLYTRASGGKKLTGAAKAPLTGAAWRLKVSDRLVIDREGATTIENDDVLRAAGAPRGPGARARPEDTRRGAARRGRRADAAAAGRRRRGPRASGARTRTD